MSKEYKFSAFHGDGDAVVGPYVTSLADDGPLKVDSVHWLHQSGALTRPYGADATPSMRLAVFVFVPAMLAAPDLDVVHPMWLVKLSVLSAFLKALKRAGLADTLTTMGPEAARAEALRVAETLPAATRTLKRADVLLMQDRLPGQTPAAGSTTRLPRQL